MRKELNKSNVNQRDLVLFYEPYDEKKYYGGIRHFDAISYADCQELCKLDVLNPDGRQNCAPPAKEIMEFLRLHPNFRAHGYAVSPKRDDYRVSLEGVECGPGYSLNDVWDLFRILKYPDEYSVTEDGILCWFD